MTTLTEVFPSVNTMFDKLPDITVCGIGFYLKGGGGGDGLSEIFLVAYTKISPKSDDL